jgi:DNA-directed RNA polymerase subunit M/transcription elongation factor TFIIS
MVDSDSQVDQGGNPLGEGTIVGADGETPLNTGNRGRDNYMHSSIPAVLAAGWVEDFNEEMKNRPPLGNGRPVDPTDLKYQPNYPDVPQMGMEKAKEWYGPCPYCKGEGCPACDGLGEIGQTNEPPQRAGEGYAEPYDVNKTPGIIPGLYTPEMTFSVPGGKRNFGAAPEQLAGIPCPHCGEELHTDPQTSTMWCANGHEHDLARDEQQMHNPHDNYDWEAVHRGEYPGAVDSAGVNWNSFPRYQGKTADAMQDILGIDVEPQQSQSNFLRWEPGMRGRGIVVAGEPHTWTAYDPNQITGNEGAEALGLTHKPYVESLGVNPDHVDWRTGIEIEPNGDIQTVGGHDPAAFIQADPRLKLMKNNPLDSFFSVSKHSPYSRHAPMDPYLPWTHEADAVEFDKGPLAGPQHAVMVNPGPAGIHGAHYKWLDLMDAHLDGQPARQLGVHGLMMSYADPSRKQPVEVKVHHPDHIPAIQEQLEMGQSQPVPAMLELQKRVQNGEVPPPPPREEQPQQVAASTKEAIDAPEVAGWAGGGMAGQAAGEAIGTALMPGVGTVAGGFLGKVAGGLMGKALGGVFGGGGGGNASMPEEQPNLALAAVFVADYETPASNPDVGVKNDNDPEKVDQKEFNDQDHSPENLLNPNLEDSGASGEDGVREHAGFAPDSPGLDRLNMLLPLVTHYYHSPESGENDPQIRALHEALEAENPGYLDRVTPEDEQLAEEFIRNQAQKPHGIHAKTAIVNVDPNDINQHLENMVAPSGNPQVQPGAMPQQGTCPQCGGVLNGTGACPQCGAGAMAGGNPQTPMPTPGALPQGFASNDPVMALVAANHQGPTTPEQIAAVQELLIQQGRAEETPNVPIEPWNYAKELASIQQQPNVAPQVQPGEQPQPPTPQPAPQGAMPMPGMGGGEPGGQPMQPMAHVAADNVARRCPVCGSATTGMMADEENHAQCHACGHVWKAEGAVTDKSVNKESRVAAPENPVDAPAAERHQPRNPEAEEDSSLTWHDVNNQKLVPGQEYEMINPKYELPDIIRVEHVKPDGIEVSLIGTIANDPNTLQARTTISRQELEMDHMQFAPVADSMEDRGNQPPPGQQAPGEPPRPQTTDELETPHAMAPTSSTHDHCPKCGWKEYTSSMASADSYFNECHRCLHVWEEKEEMFETDHLAHTRDWINQDSRDDSFWEGMERAQGMREAQSKSRNLGDIAAKDGRLQAIKSRLNENAEQKTAGRHFTPSEQRELIDEEGVARNADLLNLEGTHYTAREDYSGKANGENVPMEHLLMGI